jgi:hypothetical protein
MKEQTTSYKVADKKLSIPVQIFESWDEVHKEVTPADSLARLNRAGVLGLNNRIAGLVIKTAADVSKQKQNDKETNAAFLKRVITPANLDAIQTAITTAIKASPLKVKAKTQARNGEVKLAEAWKTKATGWIKGDAKKLAALNTALSAALGKTYTPATGVPADAPANVLALGLLLKEFNG